jgi:hypothetical protein
MSSSENPWTAVPARRLSGYQVNVRVHAILGLLVFAAVAGPLALALTLLRGADSPDATFSGPDPVARLAMQAAAEFASGLPTTVVAADRVDVLFGSELGDQPQSLLLPARRPLVSGIADVSVVDRVPGRYLGGREYEMVTVQVVGEGGGRVLLTVPVFRDGPALAAGISILPTSQGGRTRTPALDYADHPQRSAPSGALRRVVEEWAQAWASGDAPTLKRLTGDSQPGQYRPLGGFRLERAEIVSVIDLYETVSRNEVRTVQAVRVSVLMSPAGGPLSPFRAEYDLRVDNPFSDFPLITAWGPAGSSPLLPYQNRE